MTIAGNGAFPSTPRQAAEMYLARGLAPIPVRHRAKNPVLEGWQKLRPSPDDLDRFFPQGQALNVGLLLGTPSRGLIDIDLDAPEAVAAGQLLLPATGWISGRKSKPRSHWWYVVADPPSKAQDKYIDFDGTDLLELRSTGGQTVVPPGVHESGEPIVWESFATPTKTPLSELTRVVRTVAAAALLARHWPVRGDRQDAALALAGGLLRAGWDEARVSTFIQAVITAAQDEELQMRLNVVARTARKIKDGEKASGWPALVKIVGAAVVNRVRSWLCLPAEGADAAPCPLPELPLPEPPQWPEPPAAEAFYGLAGRIVQAIEPASEADRAALLVQTLVAFGNVIGRTGHFTVEDNGHYGNEFVVLIGRTSKARKGTSWGRINRLFSEAEEQWAADRVQSGASSGEGIIWSVRDAIMKRERVKEKGTVRYEEVEADAGVPDKRLLVYEPEFANVLKQTERQGNTLSVILRQAWDGNALRSLTKNSPARATGAHISMIGHITGDELRRYLTATESANGFGNRFLWLCVQRSKSLPEGGQVDRAALVAAQAELVESLAFARTLGEVHRDDLARDIWCDIYDELSRDKPGLAGALLARAEAHVMRLALLYALLDRSDAIRAPHLLAALALWNFCERSVFHAFGDDLGDPVADDLRRLLRSSPNGLTRKEMHDYFGRHQSAGRIGGALGLLLKHRLARFERQETEGRPAERWFAIHGPTAN